MLTVKQVKKVLETMPEDAEVCFLIEGENPMSEAWTLFSMFFVQDLLDKKTKVVFTNGELKDFH